MREVMTGRRPAEKPRAIPHVGAPIDDWFEQNTVVTRIVFQVRILYRYDLSGSLRKPSSQRRAFALVACLKEESHVSQGNLAASLLCWSRFVSIRLPRRHVLRIRPRTFCRPVIDHHRFFAYPRRWRS